MIEEDIDILEVEDASPLPSIGVSTNVRTSRSDASKNHTKRKPPGHGKNMNGPSAMQKRKKQKTKIQMALEDAVSNSLNVPLWMQQVRIGWHLTRGLGFLKKQPPSK